MQSRFQWSFTMWTICHQTKQWPVQQLFNELLIPKVLHVLFPALHSCKRDLRTGNSKMTFKVQRGVWRPIPTLEPEGTCSTDKSLGNLRTAKTRQALPQFFENNLNQFDSKQLETFWCAVHVDIHAYVANPTHLFSKLWGMYLVLAPWNSCMNLSSTEHQMQEKIEIQRCPEVCNILIYSTPFAWSREGGSFWCLCLRIVNRIGVAAPRLR